MNNAQHGVPLLVQVRPCHSAAKSAHALLDGHGRASDINQGSQLPTHTFLMNRVQLVEILASKNDLSKAAANAVLDTLIETVQTAVKKGDAVQLVGFGTFKSTKRAARTGKNPATGATLKIPASTVPKFVPGAKFKAVVDPKAAKRKAEKAGK